MGLFLTRCYELSLKTQTIEKDSDLEENCDYIRFVKPLERIKRQPRFREFKSPYIILSHEQM